MPAVKARMRQSTGADRADRRRQQRLTPASQRKAEDPTRARQHEAFGQKLANETPRAWRRWTAGRKFRVAAGCARKQQIRHIRAHEHEHQRDHSAEHRQRRNLALVVVVRAAACRIDEQVRDGCASLVLREGSDLVGCRLEKGLEAGARLALKYRLKISVNLRRRDPGFAGGRSPAPTTRSDRSTAAHRR